MVKFLTTIFYHPLICKSITALEFTRAVIMNAMFRALRLTSHATVTNSRSKLEEIKANLVDPMIRVKETNKDIKLKVKAFYYLGRYLWYGKFVFVSLFF